MKKKNKIQEIHIDDLPTEFDGIDLETEIYLTDDFDNNGIDNSYEDYGTSGE